MTADLRALAERAAIGVLPADYPLENLAKGSEVFSLQQQLADEIERVAKAFAEKALRGLIEHDQTTTGAVYTGIRCLEDSDEQGFLVSYSLAKNEAAVERYIANAIAAAENAPVLTSPT